MLSSHDIIVNFIGHAQAKQAKEQSWSPVRTPLLIGLSGPQGSGKSTVVKRVADEMRTKGLNVVILSLDDFYVTHAEQVKLRESGNSLFGHRGPPGTHDIKLCVSTLKSLLRQEPTYIVQFDKSLFQGEGDRVPETEYVAAKPEYDVILFEGWCVGFRALPDSADLERAWRISKLASNYKLDDIKYVNTKLEEYDEIWELFNGFVHLDAHDINFVYKWRTEAEHTLISAKGSGMTDEQVRKFVDGYMPMYELYLEKLRHFRWPAPMVRIHLGSNREVVSVVEQH